VTPRVASVTALVLALVLVLGGRASSEDPPRALDVKVEVGFDNLFVDGTWTPVRVTLATPPRALALSGTVVVEPLPFERVSSFAAPFELPASPEGARARVTVAVPARGDLSFTVRVDDERGRTLAREKPEPRHVDANQRLVLVARASGLSAFADPPARAGGRARARR
jgi:hypothetical protein